MSKEISIYDEAMKIFKGTDTNRTQEEMLAIDNLFDVVKEEYLLLLSEDENDKIIKALERAKKAEELLGLYRKHINTLCKKDREGVKNSLFSSEHLAYELYEKIKQKEKELEELK